MHAFILYPSGPIASAVQMRQNVSGKAINLYSARLKRAISVFPTGRGYLRLAHLRDIEASRIVMDSEKKVALRREVVRLLSLGLAMRPAGGYAWSRLAQLDLESGRKEKGISALGMSHENALYDKSLAVSRLNVGLKLYPHLDEGLRGKVANELIINFEASPRDLVRLAWDDPIIHRAINEIFSESPERLNSFENMYDPFSRIVQE